jgi:hypothetical protein
MIKTRLLFEVSITSLLLASSAAALRSSAPRFVLVENRASIQNAIDVAENEAVDETQRQLRQIPPPTDIDPKLTEKLRQLEQQFCDAILHKDAKILDHLVGPEFTLRVADIPQGSLPRAIWMDNTLNRRKAESCEQRYHAGRKLADDIGVVSLIWAQRATTDGRDISADFYVVDFWKRSGADWQIFARYSSPVGNPPDRPPRQLPTATDSDPKLTDLLRQLEEELNEPRCTDLRTQKPWSDSLARSSHSVCRTPPSAVFPAAYGGNRVDATKSS